MTAVDLAYDDVGEGPVVVLIHGHPFNRSMWAPQLAALREHFRVIAPDLRGYGESPVTAGTVTMAQLAADVAHLLDTQQIGTAALAGLSMGGLVVMELAAAQPQRWWALGFVATTAQPVTAAEKADRRAKARTAEEQGMRPLAEEMAARLFGPDPGEALTSQVMAMMLATNPKGAAAALRGTTSFVCAGDHDTFSTAAITKELTGCLRDPQLVVLEGVGHLPNLERPGDFNRHLLGFLGSARPEPG
jgi:3-oxoadipate enol-lactonase